MLWSLCLFLDTTILIRLLITNETFLRWINEHKNEAVTKVQNFTF